jgi:hypothetical protein
MSLITMNDCLCNYFSNLDDYWSSMQLGYDYDVFHPSNGLVFHNVFVFFTTSDLHLVTHVDKIIT